MKIKAIVLLISAILISAYLLYEYTYSRNIAEYSVPKLTQQEKSTQSINDDNSVFKTGKNSIAESTKIGLKKRHSQPTEFKDDMESDVKNELTDLSFEFIDEEGQLNGASVAKALKLRSFSDFLNQLEANASDTDVLRGYAFSESLASLESLSSYSYESACGNDICSVVVSAVNPEASSQILDEIISVVNRGSSISRLYGNNSNSNDLRIVFLGTGNQTNNSISFPIDEVGDIQIGTETDNRE